MNRFRQTTDNPISGQSAQTQEVLQGMKIQDSFFFFTLVSKRTSLVFAILFTLFFALLHSIFRTTEDGLNGLKDQLILFELCLYSGRCFLAVTKHSTMNFSLTFAWETIVVISCLLSRIPSTLGYKSYPQGKIFAPTASSINVIQ